MNFLKISGTLTELEPTPTKVVYQSVAPGTGNLLGDGTWNQQRRRHVIPIDPKTPAQVAHRQRFAAAVQAWHLMTAEQRQEWRQNAKQRNLTPFNAFMSHALKR